MGCASEDAESLGEAVEALRRDGLEVELCEGLDHDPRRLSDVIDRHAGRGLYVLCRSPRLGRERVEELREILLARHVPFARTLTVAVGGRGALADRIRAGLRRASARTSGPNRAVGFDAAPRVTNATEDEEPTLVGKREGGEPDEELELVPSQPLPPPPRVPPPSPAPREVSVAVEAVDTDLLNNEETNAGWSVPTIATAADLDLSDLDEGNTGPTRAPRGDTTSVGTQPALITGNTAVGPAPAMITGDTVVGERLPRALREAAGRWPLQAPDGGRPGPEGGDASTTPFPRMSMPAAAPSLPPPPSVTPSLVSPPSLPPPSAAPSLVLPPPLPPPSVGPSLVSPPTMPPPSAAASASFPAASASFPSASGSAAARPSSPPGPPPGAWASGSASAVLDDPPIGRSKLLPLLLGVVALSLLALVIALAVSHDDREAEVASADQATAGGDAPATPPTPSAATPADRAGDAKADDPAPEAPAVYPVVAALESRKVRALDVLLVATTWGKPSDYSTASAYCDALDVEGLRGWRLPHIGELFSLAQASMLSRGMFWSSTAADTFGDGHMAWNARRWHALPHSADAVALCVRGEANGS